MPFRSEQQQAIAIQTLLEASRLPAFYGQVYFTDGGMTGSFEWLVKNRRKLSHGEQIFVDAAYDFWTWRKTLKLWDLTYLNEDLAELVLGLFLAFMHGGDEVERWIQDHKQGGAR